MLPVTPGRYRGLPGLAHSTNNRAVMDLNSPLFNRIRIKPTADAPRGAEPACDHKGCSEPGSFRAPKGRSAEGQYWHFCKTHVTEYNKSYNYFTGMTDDAVMAFQKDASIGHRPTWSMGVNGSRPRGGGDPTHADFDHADPLGILRSAGFEHRRRAPEPQRPKRPAPVLRALETLDLDENADAAAIKAQYKVLVKRFHPDAHGGDRSFEDRLRDIIRAHDTLKAAGLC
jgi:hypothetical protein